MTKKAKLYFIVWNLGVFFMEFYNLKTDTEVYETHLPFSHLHTEWSSKKSMQNTFNVEASSNRKLKVLHAVLSTSLITFHSKILEWS
jgi:hypothetical protein